MQSTVLGATGIVGSFIKQKLVNVGEKPFALSRHLQPNDDGAIWFRGDLTADNVTIPPSEVIYSTVHPLILAHALDRLATPALKKVVFFTSTSIVTKFDSPNHSELLGIRQLAEGEQKLQRVCEKLSVDWITLRPTIVYMEGRDANVTRLAGLIKRFKFFPLSGMGSGLRQPVHAEDLAIGAIAAASTSRTTNRVYALPGGDVISYREMIGRIFDGVGQSRIILPLPPAVWSSAFFVLSSLFPNVNSAMGGRMSKDMVFDGTPASFDFGWNPRSFRPRFA